MPGWFTPGFLFQYKTGTADGFLSNDSFKLFSEEITKAESPTVQTSRICLKKRELLMDTCMHVT